MARSYTTAFQASRNLTDLLTTALAASGFVEVQVDWGYPGEDSAAELVWVGEFETADQEPAALGQRRREERYIIGVYVDVAMHTDTPSKVNERIGEIVRKVEEAVHSDPHLGNALGADGWAQVGDLETVVATQDVVTDKAFGGVVRLGVTCRARI